MSKSVKLPQLPSMQCDDGCGLCCGVIVLRREEFRRIEALVKVRGITPRRQGTRCPLYIDGKCSIYEGRPDVCKLYGHVERLNCPRGYNVNITREEEIIWQKHMKDAGHGMRFMHELVYLPGEMPAIIEQAKLEP